jgi:hypothetical protein
MCVEHDSLCGGAVEGPVAAAIERRPVVSALLNRLGNNKMASVELWSTQQRKEGDESAERDF